MKKKKKYELSCDACAKENCQNFYKAVDYMKSNQFTKAFPILEFLSVKGCPSALVNLGWMYKTGNGVEIDNGKAINFYLLASQKGNNISMYNLAMCYANGDGVQKDVGKAFEWLQEASDNGNEKAEEILSNLECDDCRKI